MPNAALGEPQSPNASGANSFTRKKIASFLTALTITSGGLTAMVWSHEDAQTKACIVDANVAINAAERVPDMNEDILRLFREDWIDYCQVDPNSIEPIAPHP